MEKERFREMRKELGLSQAQLAKRFGVTQSVISKIETGRRKVRPTHIAFLETIKEEKK